MVEQNFTSTPIDLKTDERKLRFMTGKQLSNISSSNSVNWWYWEEEREVCSVSKKIKKIGGPSIKETKI